MFYVDTLAAACAGTGEFVKAIEMQKRAIELLGDGDADPAYDTRLKLYQDGKPYRE